MLSFSRNSSWQWPGGTIAATPASASPLKAPSTSPISICRCSKRAKAFASSGSIRAASSPNMRRCSGLSRMLAANSRAAGSLDSGVRRWMIIADKKTRAVAALTAGRPPQRVVAGFGVAQQFRDVLRTIFWHDHRVGQWSLTSSYKTCNDRAFDPKAYPGPIHAARIARAARSARLVSEGDQRLDDPIFLGLHQAERLIELIEPKGVSGHRRWIQPPILEETKHLLHP